MRDTQVSVMELSGQNTGPEAREGRFQRSARGKAGGMAGTMRLAPRKRLAARQRILVLNLIMSINPKIKMNRNVLCHMDIKKKPVMRRLISTPLCNA